MEVGQQRWTLYRVFNYWSGNDLMSHDDSARVLKFLPTKEMKFDEMYFGKKLSAKYIKGKL